MKDILHLADQTIQVDSVRQAEALQEAVVLAHLAEVQVDPVELALVDPDQEGGINSPFFFQNSPELNHSFVSVTKL